MEIGGIQGIETEPIAQKGVLLAHGEHLLGQARPAELEMKTSIWYKQKGKPRESLESQLLSTPSASDCSEGLGPGLAVPGKGAPDPKGAKTRRWERKRTKATELDWAGRSGWLHGASRS